MTSVIGRLGLTNEELDCLREQGFVSRERRRGRCYHKLRFRGPSGEQRVRYLGSDLAVVEQIEQELAELQANRRLECELRELTKQARKKLRSSKTRLALQLHEAGFYFHGMSIRRRRTHR